MKTAAIAGLSILLLALFFECCPSSASEGPAGAPSPGVVSTAPAEAPTAVAPEAPAPTDTPVSHASATPSMPALEVRPGRTYLRGEWFFVLGEVVNNTDYWHESVKIVGSYYDANGSLVGTNFDYTELHNVAPHDAGVFEMGAELGSAASEVASCELQVQGRVTDDRPYAHLSVTVSNEYESRGWYHLVGEVTNSGDVDCESVKIVVGYYDAEGNVVGVDFDYTDVDPVPAGGKSPFDTGLEDIPSFEQYKVWVEGRPVRG